MNKINNTCRVYWSIYKMTNYFIIFCLVFVSCSKEKDTLTPIYFPYQNFFETDVDHSLKSISVSHNEKYIFRYNLSGFVSNIYHLYEQDTVDNYEFYYDSYNRLSQLKRYGLYIFKEKIIIIGDYEYLKNKVIINENYYTVRNDSCYYSYKYVLFYNDIGECIQSDFWNYYNDSGKAQFVGCYTTYEWENKNMVLMTEYANYSVFSTYKFEYDTIENPIRELSCFLVPGNAFNTYMSKNLIKSEYYNNVLTQECKNEYASDSILYKYRKYDSNSWSVWMKFEF